MAGVALRNCSKWGTRELVDRRLVLVARPVELRLPLRCLRAIRWDPRCWSSVHHERPRMTRGRSRRVETLVAFTCDYSAPTRSVYFCATISEPSWHRRRRPCLDDGLAEGLGLFDRGDVELAWRWNFLVMLPESPFSTSRRLTGSTLASPEPSVKSISAGRPHDVGGATSSRRCSAAWSGHTRPVTASAMRRAYPGPACGTAGRRCG